MNDKVFVFIACSMYLFSSGKWSVPIEDTHLVAVVVAAAKCPLGQWWVLSRVLGWERHLAS
jgi:hypothetical protein